MNVLSLGGCGAMGRATSRALAEHDAVSELVIADADVETAESFAAELPGTIRTVQVDVTDHADLVSVIEDADIVANALPYRFNIDVMDACLEAECHYLDLGGLYHKTQEQLDYDDEFATAGLTAVLGIGASPGMTNIATAMGATRLDSVRSIHIRTGARGGEEGFAYSAKTILDELTMAPVVYQDGEFRTLDPLSGRETYTMPEPVGEVEGFHSIHSELATMPKVFDDVEDVDFRVAFSPDLVNICEVLINLDLTSEETVEYKGVETTPREFLEWHLDRQQDPVAVEEWKSFRVDVTGLRDGEREQYRYTTVVESRLDDWGLKATAVWTGVPMAVGAVLVGEGNTPPGAKPPEELFDPEQFIAALGDYGIEIKEERIE